MKQPGTTPASFWPNNSIHATVSALQQITLVVILALGGVTLAGWIIPPLGRVLPHFFAYMRANTSFLVTLCGLSVYLSMPLRSPGAVLMGRAVGGFVTGFASLILLKDLGVIKLPIETLLASDANSIYPGKVSPEAASLFIVLGILLVGLRACKSLLSNLIDALTLFLCLAMLIFLARYFFGLSHLFVLYQSNPFSIQTLVCLVFLTGLLASRRAEYGLLAILLDSGSGGMTVRLAVPFAILLPFFIAVPKALLVRVNPDQESASTAIATSLLSVSAVCFVLLLGWRTRAFEATVRELSLRDELTGLYNRRGFYVLAEQAFQLAKRPRESFSILFFDLDNLKQVNDALGHDVGSELIKEMAELLLKTFRKDDVIGRIGGDEYVVAGKSNDPEMSIAIQRLEEAVIEANSAPGRKYRLSFSLGSAASGDDPEMTLEELITKADTTMYENKRRKRHGSLKVTAPIEKQIPAG
jgi:diguanylate cyclase (GGDEF)-like protein